MNLRLDLLAMALVVSVGTTQGVIRDAGAQPMPRVAVLDFSNGTPIDAARYDVLRRVLGTTLAGALTQTGRVQVLERNRLSDLIAEVDLGRSGRMDDATAARWGKLLGVQYLVLGAFLVQPNGEMIVSTRLVNVSTGDVSAGPEVVGRSKAATDLISRLVSGIRTQLRWPADTGRISVKTRELPELDSAIDALARACDAHDAAAVTAQRAIISARAPSHPVLAAPCY
jgi:curli biogenesis system outer membrane secretion channel CsgG